MVSVACAFLYQIFINWAGAANIIHRFSRYFHKLKHIKPGGYAMKERWAVIIMNFAADICINIDLMCIGKCG